MTKRNASVELYRCILMFGICMIHACGYYGSEWHWLSSAFMWCVPGFVFITGYFGCRFSLGRIIRIYGVALWCFPVSMFVLKTMGGGGIGCLKGAWTAFLENWFIHAYVVLLMVVPVVDAAISGLGKEVVFFDALKVFGPIFFLVFVWSYLADFNATKAFVPRSPGLTGYSGWTLTGVYIAARVFQTMHLDNRIPAWMASGLFLVSIALSMLKVGQYNSLVALAAAASGFVLFLKLRLNGSAAKIVLLASPSMFSVFLMHANGFVFRHIKLWVDAVNAYVGILPVSFFAVAAVIFVCGLILDVPRRMIMVIVHKACWHLGVFCDGGHAKA